jgi:predicted ribosome quality control (RQC) complex YloA/Tae2 family protein
VSLNYKEIDLVLEELPLENSHIQKIHQPDFKTLLFDLYSPGRRFGLIISLEQNRLRLHEVTERPKNRVKLQRFAQFLRSRITGGRITKAYQLDGERIVKLTVVRGGEVSILWIRLWGGAANVIVTDDEGTILDAFYRRPGRSETTGERFEPEGNPEAYGLKGKPNREFTVRDFGDGESFNRRIERHYGRKEFEEALEAARDKALRLAGEKETRLESGLKRVRAQIEEYREYERLKEFGDILASNIHRLSEGDAWLTAEDFFHDNEEVSIELDTSLSPSGNAERYYEKYRKAKSGLEHLKKDEARLRRELEAAKNEEEWIGETEELTSLEEYIQREQQGRTRRRPSAEEETPGLRFRSGEFDILVGRTAKENDELLRRHVKGNDYWLHTRDYPGGYVFIKNIPGKSVPLQTLLDAGNLALFYSKGRSSGKGELYYTQAKYLRRAKHGKLGLVIPTQEKNLSVQLEEDRIRRLHDAN